MNKFGKFLIIYHNTDTVRISHSRRLYLTFVKQTSHTGNARISLLFLPQHGRSPYLTLVEDKYLTLGFA